MEYKITIDTSKLDYTPNLENPIDKEEVVAEVNKPITQKTTSNASNDMMKPLLIVSAVYGLGRQAAQMGTDYVVQNYSLRGDTLKAERLQTRFSNTTNNIGLGLGLGLSIATGNPIAIAMTAYGLAQRAFNLALETRKYVAEVATDKYRSQYYQERLVKDITGVR
jgi:hypothetical protein